MSDMLTLTDTETLVIRAVERKGGRCWITGGAIRDLLLNQKPKDIDLVTDLPPSLSSGAMAERGLKVIKDQTAWDHGIIRIATYQGIVDLATLRRDQICDGRHATIEFADSIEEDLMRRDLSINALAAEIDTEGNLGKIIDPAGGQRDIKEPCISMVGMPDQRIKEDYLRMVRACRFMALWPLQPRMDQATRICIRRLAEKINTVSKERIRDEILKAMAYPRPANFIRALHDCQLLEHCIPLLSNTVGVEGGGHHEETVFVHLLLSLDAATDLTNNILLRLAALLHDCGKPGTTSIDSKGNIHFYKHEIQGMIDADNWMSEYKFSNKDKAYVTKLIKNHQWRFYDNTKDKTLKRWLREVGEQWKDLITLRACDRKGNLAKTNKPIVTKQMRSLIERVSNILASKDPVFNLDLAINGYDLIALDIEPGPIYKQIFRDIWGLVINEPNRNTKEELLKIIRRKYVNS